MAVFILTDADQERIRFAAERARAEPITLDMLKRHAFAVSNTADVPKRVTAERPATLPQPQIIMLTGGWRLNISCEHQPAGPFLHLSLSSPTPQRTAPRREVVDLVLEALGYDPKLTPLHMWPEDFIIDGKPGGVAVNILVPLLKPQVGHA